MRVWAPVSGKRVAEWSNFAGRQDTIVWQSSHVRGKPPAAWLGFAADMKAARGRRRTRRLVAGDAREPSAWGRPAPWQRAQARLAWAPASGNVAGCEKAELDQVGAVTLWQSSQRREKPAAAWLGFVVARYVERWQLPHSAGVVAYWKGRWLRWQAAQSSRACVAKSGSRVRLWTWSIWVWLVQLAGRWQDSHCDPSSPRCASLWQSAQAVPT